MKIEQLIVHYLYNTNKVHLQGIGSFILNSPLPVPSEMDKPIKIPDESITFKFDLKAYEDEGLIDFISKQTGKIKPLASADLDSFIMLAKQFLNIGKPFTIEGIGTIQKNQQGEYYFVSGQFITPKLEDMTKQVREKRDETVSFESLPKKKDNIKATSIATILLILILLGLGVYYIFFYTKNNTLQSIQSATIQIKNDSIPKDTTHNTVKDTLIHQNQISLKDSISYKVVLKEFTSRVSAEKFSEKLNSYGHKNEVIQKDSFSFSVVIPFSSTKSDTLRIKDSLDKFFNVRSYILIK